MMDRDRQYAIKKAVPTNPVGAERLTKIRMPDQKIPAHNSLGHLRKKRKTGCPLQVLCLHCAATVGFGSDNGGIKHTIKGFIDCFKRFR